MVKTAEQILEGVSKKNIPLGGIELMLNLHGITNGNAAEAERILQQEPYASKDQDYSRVTIRRYWRLGELEIGKHGGSRNSGMSWKQKRKYVG